MLRILKSNMDRFIAAEFRYPSVLMRFLKSNMDRFIVRSDNPIKSIIENFKIQYG